MHRIIPEDNTKRPSDLAREQRRREEEERKALKENVRQQQQGRLGRDEYRRKYD